MKVLLPVFFFASALVVLAAGTNEPPQPIRISVVDMHDALIRFWKTDGELDLMDEKEKELMGALEEQDAMFQQQAVKMKGLFETANNSLLPEDDRRKAAVELNGLSGNHARMEKELREGKLQAKLTLERARQEMEKRLMGEIQEAVDHLVEEGGHDLVFDKSFLPKANKAILHTSGKVTDLTDEVVRVLNLTAPAKKN